MEKHEVLRGEIETVFIVLDRNKVIRRDSRQHLPQLPDKFYGSIVVHLAAEADAGVIEQHIAEGLQHYGLLPDSSRITQAVSELVTEANGWERRGKVNSRAENITAYQVLLQDNEKLFGRLIAAGATRSRNLPTLVADYPMLGDGKAYHHQHSGWRMVVDILMERLKRTSEPDPDGPDWNPNLHVQYEELVRCQLAYPFLGAWRLSIEVAMKATVTTMYNTTTSPIPSKLGKSLKSHNIDKLWDGIKNEVMNLEQQAQSVAQCLGHDPVAPGLILDPTLYNDAVAHLVSIDPDGQSVRYERDLQNNPNMPQITRIDLAGLHDEMSVLYSYLGHLQQIGRVLTSLSRCGATLASLRAGEPLYPVSWADL